MAKTITELEDSDINLKGDDLHALIYTHLLVSLLMIPKNPEGDKTAAMEKWGASAVAVLLNTLSRKGYAITKHEEIPSIFREA